MRLHKIIAAICLSLVTAAVFTAAGEVIAQSVPPQRDLLYAALPGGPGGGRDPRETAGGGFYLGTGVLVFDVADNYSFVKRIPTWDIPASRYRMDKVDYVQGIQASVATQQLYLGTSLRLGAIDLTTDKIVWEETYDGECCDQMTLSPDGKLMYVPAGAIGAPGTKVYAVEAATGKLIKIIPTPDSLGVHNMVFSPDGSRAFVGGVRSPIMSVIDPQTHTVVQKLKFSDGVRPFTVNGDGSLVFANVNRLNGFEVMDVRTGKILHRVEVSGFGDTNNSRSPHGVPSHGIGLTPDEKELWLADGVNGYFHVYDATVMPPKQVSSIRTRLSPNWVTFGLDGKTVLSPTGEIIDRVTKKVIAQLKDEFGRPVYTEKIIEARFEKRKLTRVVDRFGIGQVRKSTTTSAR